LETFEISVKRFDEFADEYANRFNDISAYTSSIDFFCDAINKTNPHILELGCGPGNVTRYLKNKFQKSKIIAIDLSPKMIEIARKEVTDVDFKLMDVREILLLERKFDSIMCSFCLPFLSKNDASKLIADCASMLTSGGVIYISTMEGDESEAGFEPTSFSGDSKIYFNYHNQKIVEQDLLNNGFQIIQSRRQDYFEPNGNILTDLIIIGKR
jgi:ubiquinone/menaquinone biosynthesis C-methylase UbiE